jgi:cytochrome c
MKIKPLLLLPFPALLGAATPPPAEPSEPAGTPSPAAIAEGQMVFKQRCQTCHSTEPGQTSALGPNLAAVVGRPAASSEFRYSPALKASGLTWTPENLDAYLAAPMKLVPGTRMVVGIPDAAQRAAVVEYLSAASATPAATTAGE